MLTTLVISGWFMLFLISVTGLWSAGIAINAIQWRMDWLLIFWRLFCVILFVVIMSRITITTVGIVETLNGDAHALDTGSDPHSR